MFVMLSWKLSNFFKMLNLLRLLKPLILLNQLKFEGICLLMYKTVEIVEDVIKVWKLFEKKIRIKVRIRKKDY